VLRCSKYNNVLLRPGSEGPFTSAIRQNALLSVLKLYLVVVVLVVLKDLGIEE